jgi:hypothetical protein
MDGTEELSAIKGPYFIDIRFEKNSIKIVNTVTDMNIVANMELNNTNFMKTGMIILINRTARQNSGKTPPVEIISINPEFIPGENLSTRKPIIVAQAKMITASSIDDMYLEKTIVFLLIGRLRYRISALSLLSIPRGTRKRMMAP